MTRKYPLPWSAAKRGNLSAFLSAAYPAFYFQSRLHANFSPAM